MKWKTSNARFYFHRYFWWLRFPLYWWRIWRYDEWKEVPFKPDELNYLRGYNQNPEVWFRCYYKAAVPPGNYLITMPDGMPMARVWCSAFPPQRPRRPMPKGTIAYG